MINKLFWLITISTITLSACNFSQARNADSNDAEEIPEVDPCPPSEMLFFVEQTKKRLIEASDLTASEETGFELLGIEGMASLSASTFGWLEREQVQDSGPECTKKLDEWAEIFFREYALAYENFGQENMAAAGEHFEAGEEALTHIDVEITILTKDY